MSYQVLARKWRPQNFKQMVGQEHVLRALINALDNDRLHHAYLFTGTRGVGKTTIARILAKCLNCETGITSEPCGECNSCKEIVAGNFVDLIEVDAASRTKVEDTRELLDNVQYAPTRGRFKVYLIDEVHMLTGHSFNALLKTLEEPPPHVKFLFATTDPQKLPVTILSRCLQFNLKRMPVDMISGHLNFLLGEEKIPFDEPSVKLIARAADGSMRDALSLLDQSIAFGGNELKENDVREMLGTISHEPLLALLKAVSAGEGASILSQIEDLAGVTPDFEAATDALISLLHQLAVQQVVPEAAQDDDSVKALADELSKEEVQLFYQIALQGRRDLPLSPDPRSGFEMLFLRMMSFRPLREGMVLEQSKKKTVETEKKNTEPNKPASAKPIQTEQVQSPPATTTPINKPTVNDEPPPWEVLPEEELMVEHTPPVFSELAVSSSETDNSIMSPLSGDVQDVSSSTQAQQIAQALVESDNDKSEKRVDPKLEESSPSKIEKPKEFIETNKWHEIIPQLSLQGRSAELIKHCLLERKENGTISLVLDKSSEGLLADNIHSEIELALGEYYDEFLTLTISIDEVEAVAGNLKEDKETPSRRTQREKNEVQQQAEQNIEADPFVIELKNRFGAQVVPGSVQPK